MCICVLSLFSLVACVLYYHFPNHPMMQDQHSCLLVPITFILFAIGEDSIFTRRKKGTGKSQK